MAVVILSLSAALAFAFGAVLQQHAAAGQPLEHNMRPSLVIRLVQRPMWLAGIGMNGVGTLLQLAALWKGSLVTVQPLLVCGLLFALPINAIWLHRRRPGVRECLSAGAVCVGLTTFLLATAPTPGRGSASPLSWFIALGAIAVVTAVPIAAALRSHGPLRAGLLAVAAGVVNGLSAAFIKGIARQIEHSMHAGVGSAAVGLFQNWELYAFGMTLLSATLLVQSAFQSGPIRWSLPALTAANPVTSVIIGACVLSEQIRTGPLAIAGAVVGLGLVVGGIMALSSSSLIIGEIGHPDTVVEPASAVESPSSEPATSAVLAVDPGPATVDATD
ncbi:MAG: DMT family transporter [Acidimicrobiales bacterium]